MNISLINTPLGALEITSKEGTLYKIDFLKDEVTEVIQTDAVEIVSQLRKYFKGELSEFSIDLFLDGTDFQKQVWVKLMEVPYGETVSYGELANMIDNPKAVRAVGGANNKNKIPIVIPCHRVIGSDGSLTGYAGGLEFKKALLELEKGI